MKTRSNKTKIVSRSKSLRREGNNNTSSETGSGEGKTKTMWKTLAAKTIKSTRKKE